MFKNRALILAKTESFLWGRSHSNDRVKRHPDRPARGRRRDEEAGPLKRQGVLWKPSRDQHRGGDQDIVFNRGQGQRGLDSGHASGDRRPVRRMRDAGNRNSDDRAGRLHPAGRHRRAVDHDLLLAARHPVRGHGLPRYLVSRREGRGVRQDQVGVPGALRRSRRPYDSHGRRVQRIDPAGA